MPPIREYGGWNKRETDALDQEEPRRKYVFICEGSKTEVHYFRALVDRRNELGIHPLVGLCLWEKTEADEGLSNPQALVRFAQREKESNTLLFDSRHDRMIIVFDLDVYSRVGVGRGGGEGKAAEFDKVKESADANDILAVTNPSFELFLLLHADGAYDEFVRPNAKEILENRKCGKQRFVQRLFTSAYKMNPKRNPGVGMLAKEVDTAIREERHLNQSLDGALDELTCNIGRIIENVREDRFYT